MILSTALASKGVTTMATKDTKQATDSSAPKFLVLKILTDDGKELGEVIAPAKQFSSGSVGFYGNGKVTNPKSAARYQVGCNIILIGSKPADAKKK